MNRALLVLVVTAAATASLRAQVPPAPAPGGDVRTAERANSMREQIETGRQVQSHVRVVVRLKNGNRLRGIVKDGRLVERVDGLRFVDAHADDAGAGIRLWYSSGKRNYVFVPFREFSEYQVLQRLTQQQLEQFERDLQAPTERLPVAPKPEAPADEPPVPGGEVQPPAAEAPAAGEEPTGRPAKTSRARSSRKGKEAPAEGGAGAAGARAGNEDAVTQRAWFALLQAYPPSEGWGEKRRDEIKNRLNVIGAKPSEVEERFVAQFAEWEKAVAWFAADTKPAEGKAEAEGEATDGKKKRRR